jgi:outer membrane protein insertion porin family
MVMALDTFQIEDIRLEGLERISAGTVFNYLPLKTGDQFDNKTSEQALKSLFKTGFFNDIQFGQDDRVLVIYFTERPAISEIVFEGNKEIEKDNLVKALKGIGFAEGRVFDRSILEKVELELQRQYFSLGRYAARIKSTVTDLSRNRVKINIDISEGKAAAIKHIQLVGNEAFSDKELLDEFELSPTTFWSFFSSSDQYAKQKLAADLETLKSFYLDRGYLNFSIDSTQVSITPDKQDIYITVNLTEGKKHRITDIKLVGNLVVPEQELREKIKIENNSVFSRKQITASVEALAERLGDDGYTFANVNPVPEPISPDSTDVVLTFFVDPGKRTYVRRINFAGNTKTRDEVLRREMRQMEGAWASTAKIKRSRERLDRLNFFEDVKVETVPVPEQSDQVDINYSVTERPSGNFMAGIGYSQTQGVLFNASVSQDNFLGSGNRVSIGFNTSKVQTLYSFSYYDPYFTVDGISQSFGMYYRKTDAEQANLSSYALDAFGGTLGYGIPISEHDSVRFGIEPEHLQVKTTANSAKEVSDYIGKNGDNFNIFKLSTGWTHDTRNRILFPESGVLQSLGGEIALPLGGDKLKYYKLSGKWSWHYSLVKNYTLMLNADASYGKAYGSTDFPFFENYVAGGPRSVRGYKENTLGPRDSNLRPFGGTLRTVGNVELFFPLPLAKESQRFRLSAFFDIGNVYARREDFDRSSLRSSTGMAAIWLSPLGMLSFSLAKPLNNKPEDETQVFQFTLGANFN